jgi:hypothetical protein
MGQPAPELDTLDRLGPVLPEGQDPRDALDDDTAHRLRANWEQLEEMGFDLELRRDSLRVQHRTRRFETVIQLSHENDLGERRALYRELRSAFGRITDRLFSWVLQPSRSVVVPYEGLKEVISICQSLRKGLRV